MRLTNATLPDGSKHDIEVLGGRIAALLPVSQGDALDLGGALVLPPLVDGHIHLDKTLLGLPWVP
ncbi:MAG TPA: cytosine deaminase, partial [Reyranella sp.]|nr:cytosine deaminase [Reyranella sp.]